MKGHIEIICGPMYSGKTEELLRRLTRLQYANTDFLLFKTEKDKRYSETHVMSHSKKSLAAINVENSLDILRECENNPHIKIIAIDEIQFLPSEDIFNARKLCFELKKRGYRVIASGLDMNAQGNPFGIMPEILAIADEVQKLKSVCFVCGEDAEMSAKVGEDNGEEVDIGGKEKYQAMCFKHWKENIEKDKE